MMNDDAMPSASLVEGIIMGISQETAIMSHSHGTDLGVTQGRGIVHQ